MRYLLDSDAGKPEKCEEGIWVMGILHEGWRPPPPMSGSPTREKEEGEVFLVSSSSSPFLRVLVPVFCGGREEEKGNRS